MQNLGGGGGIMTSRWFTVAMIILLVGSILALLIVNIYRKAGELRTAEKLFSERAAKKGLSESETDMLMAITVKAGLKKSEEIFGMGEAFEKGAAKLLEDSRSGGEATTETVRLEKQLAGLREKMSFRRAFSPAASSSFKPVEKSASAADEPAKPDVKSADDKPADVSARNTAFIALFPFARKIEKTGLDRQIPQFTPAIVTSVADRVVFVETTLSANVGDRVLVVLGSQGDGEEAGVWELTEDIGVVRQSTQPAEAIKAPNGRRLAVELTSAVPTGAAGRAEAGQPVVAKEEIK
jgi:hypothetical protein